MNPEIDPEITDLFDGRGNGSLHIHLARDPERWHGAESEDSVDMRLDFHPDDWVALFVDVLHVPVPNEDDLQQLNERSRYVERDEVIVLREWRRDMFREATSQYPMLGRIWDMYEDAVFRPEELPQLRDECLKLKSETTQPEPLKALRKLLYACDEATKRGFSLMLISD
jgi:hypothetical protein